MLRTVCALAVLQIAFSVMRCTAVGADSYIVILGKRFSAVWAFNAFIDKHIRYLLIFAN
jgi:hypothetical protein